MILFLATQRRPRRLVPRSRDVDPTRSLQLRARFVADAVRRLEQLKRWIRESVVDQDCFGLQETPLVLAAARPRQFAFRQDSEKASAFMEWLREQEALGILETTTGTPLEVGSPRPWVTTYVRSAYQKGLAQGRQDVRAAGVDVPSFEELPGGIAGVMNQPFHADRVALLYTRVFEDLKGVTSAMSAAINRELAQAMVEGIGPYEMARRLTKQVDGVGMVRARTIARTETIRAHNEAALSEYDAASVILGTEIKQQWWTALDERVCPVCGPRHAKVYTREEGVGLLPAHPNCRCAWLPVLEE